MSHPVPTSRAPQPEATSRVPQAAVTAQMQPIFTAQMPVTAPGLGEAKTLHASSAQAQDTGISSKGGRALHNSCPTNLTQSLDLPRSKSETSSVSGKA